MSGNFYNDNCTIRYDHKDQNTSNQKEQTTQDGFFPSGDIGLLEARRDSRAQVLSVDREVLGSGDQQPNPGRPRNTQRGLRNENKTIERNKHRSIKRKEARREHRAQKKLLKHSKPINTPGEEASAREPERSGYKLRYNTHLHFLSCNIRGLNKLAKKEQMINYLNFHNIDIVFLPETKIKHKGTRKMKGYTFSPAKPPPNPECPPKNPNTTSK